jgi:hypothetical protein
MFMTHSIFVQALRQVSWRFIVFITLLASQRAPSADEISAISSDGAPLSTRRHIRMEGLSASIVKEDESATDEIVKSRVTG